MIRPSPARWFEVLAARDDAMLLLDALGRTGAVELEARTAVLPSAMEAMRPLLHRFAELAQRYAAYWPTQGYTPSPVPEPPATTLTRAVEALGAWATDAEPLIRALQANHAEHGELALWRNALSVLDGSPIDFEQLGAERSVRKARLFEFPPDALPQFPSGALVRRIDVEAGHFALAFGTPAEVDAIGEQAAAARGRERRVPAWLRSQGEASRAFIESRLQEVEGTHHDLRAALDELAKRHDLRTALGDANRLRWVMDNIHALDAGEHFCWITGWTSDLAGTTLQAAVDGSGARALLRFPQAPDKARAPLILANPWWARPFEIFARALGMPARDEVDPSVLLALAVPLMFGYMFGDVGQGLVLAVAGFALRDRFAVARLLVAGGISAMVFGALFGSAFSLHLLQPLWVEPLRRPLDVLLVPLYGGAALLATGLLLDGLEAYWRGALPRWLATDGGLILTYLGLLAGLLDVRGFGVAAAGAVCVVIGHTIAWRSASAALPALGELIERTLQLSINTLSFARVGAFALAHAGLSSAIIALIDAAGSTWSRAAVLLIGNVVVIVLETLVVSIQTTRLVLFEFFTRFLRAEGRSFRPLRAPPPVLQESALSLSLGAVP